jgi:hypothetical protein
VEARARLVALVVGATFTAWVTAGLILSRPRPETYDSAIMLQVTRSMVEHGTFRVGHDPLGLNSPYASYGLGMSLVCAVPYTVARIVGANAGQAVNAAMTANAFVLGFAAVAVLLLARALDVTWPRALATAALVTGGTMLLPYVATGFSEPAVAVLVALGLLAISAQRRGRAWAAALGGAAAGASVLFRPESLLIVLPIVGGGVWLASGRHGRVLVQFAAATVPFLAVCAWYNDLRFGSPLNVGYGHTTGFSHSFLPGFYGLLLSPSRGLLWYVPLVAVAAVGAPAAWRRDPVVAGSATALLLARPLLFASWTSWEGGICWGPRFLVPAMPALAVGVVEVVRRFSDWTPVARSALAAVMALSIFVQVPGAIVGYEHHALEQRVPAAARGEGRDYFFAWKYFPIDDQAVWLFTRPELSSGRAVPPARNPGAFTLLLLLSLTTAGIAVDGASELRKSGEATTSEQPVVTAC